MNDRYPCFRYHATLAPVKVTSPAEEADLGTGWFDHPDKALAAAEATPETLADISVAKAEPLIEACTDPDVILRWLEAEGPDGRKGLLAKLSAKLDALTQAE